MIYNLTGLENTTGLPVLVTLNNTVGMVPMTLLVVVVGVLTFFLTTKVSGKVPAALLSTILMTILGGVFVAMGLVSFTVPIITSALAVWAAIMFWRDDEPNTL